LDIFRHLAQKSLDIRQYACGISIQSDEKSHGASSAQSLCGIALKISFQSSIITNMSVEGCASRYEDISYCGESLYQDILDWEGTSDVTYELERSSSELLDTAAEEVSYRLGSGSTAVNVTDRYIDLDGRLLKIHTFSSAYENNDEIIRRLNELIGAIELK
jgi:hypothetical protein